MFGFRKKENEQKKLARDIKKIEENTKKIASMNDFAAQSAQFIKTTNDLMKMFD